MENVFRPFFFILFYVFDFCQAISGQAVAQFDQWFPQNLSLNISSKICLFQFIGEEVGFAAVVDNFFSSVLKISFREIIIVGGESRIEIFRLK